MSGSVVQRVDAFARRQKRYWVAELRRRLKIVRHGVEKAVGRARARAAKRYERAARRAVHVMGLWGGKATRPIRIVRERVVNAGLATRNLSRKAALRTWALRRPIVRWHARRQRLREKWLSLAAETRLEERIERIAEGDAPIIVGPWLSEVGYETLYWVPFVRWFKATYRVKAERLLVLTRGGAGAWYRDITPNQVEIFDLVGPESFARHNQERTAVPGGTIKQFEMSAFERDLVERALAEWGRPAARVLHPALMYQLLQPFWAGNRSLGFLDEHTMYAPVTAPPSARPLPALPAHYVAVKFYTARSLQDTPETRRVLRDLLSALSERHPIVLLDTGLALDDHGDFDFPATRGVVSARDWMRPRDNLAVQTQIIAGAHAFVGTCGSIAWLAPMLGVPTVPVLTDDRSLNVHLHAARRVYRVMGAAPFMPLDIGVMGPMGLTVAGRQPMPIDLA